MAVEIVNCSEKESYSIGIDRSVSILDAGGLVVMPTETVYGVAARADCPDAVRRLADVKERGSDKPFTVHIGSGDAIEQYVGTPSAIAKRFIRKAWPGPLTLLLTVESPEQMPIARTIDGQALASIYFERTVGLRWVDNAMTAEVLARVAGPVVMASANRAGRTPPSTVEHAVDALDGLVDLALDGGRTRYSRASTIVRIEDERFELVREGVLDERMVNKMARMNILFVCTGNTCRSPMAQGIAEAVIAEHLSCAPDELESRNIVVSSAGTSAFPGIPPAQHAVDIVAEKGIDISSRASAALTVDLISQADHIFAMTSGHVESIVRLVPAAKQRARTLMPNEDIADPIGGDLQVYKACADTIEGALKDRLKELDL